MIHFQTTYPIPILLYFVEGYWFCVFFQLMWALHQVTARRRWPGPTPLVGKIVMRVVGCDVAVMWFNVAIICISKMVRFTWFLGRESTIWSNKALFDNGPDMFFFNKKVARFLSKLRWNKPPPLKNEFFLVLFSSWNGQVCSVVKDSVGPLNWQLFEKNGDRASRATGNEVIGAKQKWPPRNRERWNSSTKGAFLATILLESDGEKQHQEVDVISHSLTYFLMTIVIIQRRLAPWWLVMMISTWRWYNQMNHLAYSLGPRRFHPCNQSLQHAKSDVWCRYSKCQGLSQNSKLHTFANASCMWLWILDLDEAI